MGPGRDRTRDPRICSQTRICCQTPVGLEKNMIKCDAFVRNHKMLQSREMFKSPLFTIRVYISFSSGGGIRVHISFGGGGGGGAGIGGGGKMILINVMFS